MEKLIVEIVIGYMLKVMKSGENTTKFYREFASIRHGDYDTFFDIVKGERPPIVVWHNGLISDQDTVSQKTTCDFTALLLVGPSLDDFFSQCRTEYGDKYLLNNDEINNETYSNAVQFELALRMHANNNHLIIEKELLVNVITKLCAFKGIPQTSIDKLQKGRQFVNEIKHINDPGYKRKFTNWSDGIIAFEEAFVTLKQCEFSII